MIKTIFITRGMETWNRLTNLKGKGEGEWGEQHLFADGERHSVLIDKRTQRPVPVMTPMAEDGLPLNFHEAKVQKIK